MPAIAFHAHPETDDVANRWLAQSGWSDARRANAVSKLTGWMAWLDERDVDLLDADATDLQRYLDARRRAGRKANTRHDDWRFITGFYAWAAKSKRVPEIDEDPMADVKAPHLPTTPATRAARPDEVTAMETYCLGRARALRGRSGGERERALRNAAMVSLMFRSGPRSHEVAAIDLADYGCHDDLGWGITLRLTKSEEPRWLPIEARTQGLIEAYLRVRGREPGPLFLGREAHTADPVGRMKPRAVQTAVRRAATACGVPVRAHQLRRGFVAEYIRSGGDSLTLGKIGGWSPTSPMPGRYFNADQATAVAVERYRALMDDEPRLRVVPEPERDPGYQSRNANVGGRRA